MYHVDVDSLAAHFPPGLPVPPLLTALGGWLAGQPYGCVGYFNTFAGAEVHRTISPSGDAVRAMRAKLGVFLTLPEGSELALWDHGGPVPAVVNIDSEGEYRTLEASLEAFVVGWSRQVAGPWELNRDADEEEDDPDELEPTRYEEFAAFLAGQGVVVPDVPPAPDFEAWVAAWTAARG